MLNSLVKLFSLYLNDILFSTKINNISGIFKSHLWLIFSMRHDTSLANFRFFFFGQCSEFQTPLKTYYQTIVDHYKILFVYKCYIRFMLKQHHPRHLKTKYCRQVFLTWVNITKLFSMIFFQQKNCIFPRW